ncbi:MAG: type IV secretion protein Rhs [Pseudanabaena frigida]|uniref:Type IV secretion protein Rhs n=1 Tax=Pseudanabaena frigida TaxID=945775 RepID=A0A2W4VXH0_9CYAN|nr:MAG: type IV secretion protein Rhs [Pseudanabaena frigida]
MPASYIPKPLIQIDGTDASADLLEDILQISVEESLNMPGMFTLIIRNDFYPGRSVDTTWKHQSLFAIGKKVKIGFASSTTEGVDPDTQTGYVLEGEITGIETEFNEKSQAPIIIRGYDISHRLHRGRYNRSFQNVTDSDVVSQIIGEAGITSGTVTSTTIVHDYIFQENQTNMEFLRERAARLGFELYVQDAKLNFRQPTQDQELELKWLKDIDSFRVRVSSSEQVSSVEVRGWNYATKVPIVSTATTESVITSTGSGKGSASSTKFSTQPKMIVVDQPVFSADEATKMAQSLCNELGGEFVSADADGEGNPEIRPGRVVKLTGMGTAYSGSYYVTDTHHLFSERKYITKFSVRSLRGGSLLSILSSKTHLQPGQTMMVGIVSNNKDPKGWGRVRVKFPTLTEAHESNWARVVGAGAGPSRGFDCLPEINDEVLVAFEHGDIHRPYVIGGVWNGTDAPPEAVADTIVGGKVRLRTFKTRLGHKLQFVEEDKDTKKGVYTSTAGGHNFRMNDSEKFIELQTTGGHKIRCDDTNKTITIESTGQMNITAPQKISITVGGSSIELTPSGITIKTSGTISVQGASVSVQSSGSLSASAGGSLSASSGSSISASSGGSVSISGPSVSITGGIIRLN